MACEEFQGWLKKKKMYFLARDDLIKRLSISLFNQVIFNQMEGGI